MSPFPVRLLWFDSIGGLVAGAVVTPLHGWLAGWYDVPAALILFMGLANLAYGTFSGVLAARATRGRPPGRLVMVLAAANVAWGVGCFALLAAHAATASALGLAHFGLEGVYVGLLGLVEARAALRAG